MIYLADGTPVPESAVKALEDLERRWPGATFGPARPAIAAAVLGALKEPTAWPEQPEAIEAEALRQDS